MDFHDFQLVELTVTISKVDFLILESKRDKKTHYYFKKYLQNALLRIIQEFLHLLNISIQAWKNVLVHADFKIEAPTRQPQHLITIYLGRFKDFFTLHCHSINIDNDTNIYQ